jgi:hypothetical protein
MLRIDSAQQLAFIKPQANGVIGLPRARLPGRFLLRQDDREPVEVGDSSCRTVTFSLPAWANSGQYVQTRSS